MFNVIFKLCLRSAWPMICLMLAGVLVWRGNTYNDPAGPNMVAPTMCVLMALFLMLTALALTFREGDAEMTPAT